MDSNSQRVGVYRSRYNYFSICESFFGTCGNLDLWFGEDRHTRIRNPKTWYKFYCVSTRMYLWEPEISRNEKWCVWICVRLVLPVLGLSIIDCAESPHDLVLRITMLSAWNVMANIISEHLMLVPGPHLFSPFVTIMMSYAHTPTAHPAAISWFSCLILPEWPLQKLSAQFLW